MRLLRLRIAFSDLAVRGLVPHRRVSAVLQMLLVHRDCHGCDKPVRVTGRVVTGRGVGSNSQPDANPYPQARVYG
jgi:hypothetical protein